MRKQLSVIDWLLLIVPSLGIAIAVSSSELPQKWQVSAVGTALLFLTVFVIFRSAWREWSFWRVFVIAFVVHAAVLFVLLQWQLRPSTRIPVGLMGTVVLVEYFAISAAIARSVPQQKTGGPPFHEPEH